MSSYFTARMNASKLPTRQKTRRSLSYALSGGVNGPSLPCVDNKSIRQLSCLEAEGGENTDSQHPETSSWPISL